MDLAIIISAVVLGLSVLASGAKFLDWFLHSDPKTMVRTIRWMLVLLAIVGLALLVVMIMREQWTGAMLLGAGVLIVLSFLRWQAVLGPLRAALERIRPKRRPFEMPPVWEPDMAADPQEVQRAAAILESYVKQAAAKQAALTGPRELRRLDGPARDDEDYEDDDEDDDAVMTTKEALDVLGLQDGADVPDVHTAHRRLMRMADPDAGGSPYLAAKIDQARDVLIGALQRRARPTAVGPAASRRLPKN